ncbi:chemotaxis protein CheW [Haloglomus salinum]|uniref:chemotaxis protein CheW n=1 Tax=Haloglomus salinum TaxID=2962673 RepID=UPI0020C99111|nr:chemotaxis protein CheW [Haloglomus salinum]
MTGTNEETARQVLEFRLDGEAYCVSIDYVTEIVDMGDLTPIPNAPQHVKGVMDLRGETTAIIDPKVRLDIDGAVGDRIIIFDSAVFDDERSIGWAVDSVREVARVAPESVDDPPVERDHVRSIVKRDDGFVIWVDPREMDAAGSTAARAAD